jgi:hypothetical protein
MKILVLAKRHGEVSYEQIRPYVKPEVEAVWHLYAQGVIREFYTRADNGGPAILSVEAETVEAAQQALAALPMVERNLLDLEYIPLAPFNALNQLFQTAS